MSPRGARAARRGLGLAVALVLGVGSLAGCGDDPSGAADGPTSAPGSVSGASSGVPDAEPSASRSPEGPQGGPGGGTLVEVQGADDPAGAPVRVAVPSLGIDSRLDDLALDRRGRLGRPPEWQVAGWYADGPRPGQAGPAVIAGHVDSLTGPAVFARLTEVAAGDRVEVTDDDGTTRVFEVTRTETTPKRGFPTEAVYGPTPDPQLRLITCDGAYDSTRGGYQDNLLVFATQVSPAP